MGRARGANLLFLQCPRELGLQIDGRLPNLVENHRPAFGTHKKPVFGTVRAGERALHVSEELALDESRHQRAAINGQ